MKHIQFSLGAAVAALVIANSVPHSFAITAPAVRFSDGITTTTIEDNSAGDSTGVLGAISTGVTAVGNFSAEAIYLGPTFLGPSFDLNFSLNYAGTDPASFQVSATEFVDLSSYSFTLGDPSIPFGGLGGSNIGASTTFSLYLGAQPFELTTALGSHTESGFIYNDVIQALGTGSGAYLTLVADVSVTASGASASFDAPVAWTAVPDGGSTVILVGLSLGALGLARRRL